MPDLPAPTLTLTQGSTPVPPRGTITLTCESSWADRFTFYKDHQQVQSGQQKHLTIGQFTSTHTGVYTCRVGHSLDGGSVHTSNAVEVKSGELDFNLIGSRLNILSLPHSITRAQTHIHTHIHTHKVTDQTLRKNTLLLTFYINILC